MYCAKCNRETDYSKCPICGTKTTREIPTVVFWCASCNTPVIHVNDGPRIQCPICGNDAKYLCSDIRPVFPEERLLFEAMTDRPLALIDRSVWAMGSKYYVDGVPESISVEQILSTDANEIREILKGAQQANTYEFFDEQVSRFVEANKNHMESLVKEACSFIVDAAKGYEEENLVASFSGGKDSTVTADLAVRALSNPYLVHIYGDTTLEFPYTTEYANRFKEDHPLCIFKTARNQDQDFYEVAEEIGPPARMMRWCCSMFKTGPITRAFNGLYGNESILTFQGVRKAESVARSKYNRIEDNAESVKIQKQKVALPIFYWNDIDVWLYILSERLDFNEAYRLGYERVGCWCCPNNNPRAEFLSKVYMPDKAEKWRNFLIGFSRRIGKLDAEEYVDTGKWKARQGGNGLAAADTIKVEATRCATEDNAVVFSISRPYGDEIVNLFTPIGKKAPDLGRKLLDETVFVDAKTNEPLIAVMPFVSQDSEHSVKVRLLRGDSETLLRVAKYQVTKFNACRQCLKCESLCRFGAISITAGEYMIDDQRCTRCRQCVTDKYLEGGCLMKKYLRTKEQ